MNIKYRENIFLNWLKLIEFIMCMCLCKEICCMIVVLEIMYMSEWVKNMFGVIKGIDYVNKVIFGCNCLMFIFYFILVIYILYRNFFVFVLYIFFFYMNLNF